MAKAWERLARARIEHMQKGWDEPPASKLTTNRKDVMHHTMVPSDRVQHVTVYGRDGTKLGTNRRQDLLLSERSGADETPRRRLVSTCCTQRNTAKETSR